MAKCRNQNDHTPPHMCVVQGTRRHDCSTTTSQRATAVLVTDIYSVSRARSFQLASLQVPCTRARIQRSWHKIVGGCSRATAQETEVGAVDKFRQSRAHERSTGCMNNQRLHTRRTAKSVESHAGVRSSNFPEREKGCQYIYTG